MPKNGRLSYPWLRKPQLILPLFEKGDRVRPRRGSTISPSYPLNSKSLPGVSYFSSLSYEVEDVVFQNTRAFPGWLVKLAGRPREWFWAVHFRRADLRGWIAPASDLARAASNPAEMKKDSSWAWASPCWNCRTPRRWYLIENDPRDKCQRCGWMAHDHRKTRWIEDKLRKLECPAPGKRVVPIGPAVLPKILPGIPDDSTIGPLNPGQEYIVEDFYGGEESSVTLRDVKGVYSVNFLKVV
jgi:hypothetical protein